MATNGILEQVCISDKKGTPKSVVPRVDLKEDHGIVGDAHAGPWHRQVSILDETDIRTMESKGIELAPGAFGENLILSGLDLKLLGIGSGLRIGDAELEITQIGKVCHDRCAIYTRTGDCIMPRLGVFTAVVKGGSLSSGMSVDIIRTVSRDTKQAAVLTLSDRCSTGERQDSAGPACSKILMDEMEANICWEGVLPDEFDDIVRQLKDLCGRGIDIVLTVGGTGCTRRDVTPEATRVVIDREVPGLAEAMRSESMKITPNAMLQRGICGIKNSTLIVNLPGSEKGASENLGVILPAISHAISHLRGEHVH